MSRLVEAIRHYQNDKGLAQVVLREEANTQVYFSPELMAQFVAALAPPHTPVVSLLLCGYTLPRESLDILSTFLRKATSLYSIDMSFCSLSSDDVHGVLSGVMDCTPPTGARALRVSFGYNKLDNRAGGIIATQLRRRPGRVMNLSVRSNDIRVEGACELLASDLRLETLDLAFTQLCSPYDAMFTVLHNNTSLYNLKLSGASFTDEEHASLNRSTIQNPKSRLRAPCQVVIMDPQAHRAPSVSNATETSMGNPAREVSPSGNGLPPQAAASPVQTLVHVAQRQHTAPPQTPHRPAVASTELAANNSNNNSNNIELLITNLCHDNKQMLAENVTLKNEIKDLRELLSAVMEKQQELVATIKAPQQQQQPVQMTRPSGIVRRSATGDVNSAHMRPKTPTRSVSPRQYASNRHTTTPTLPTSVNTSHRTTLLDNSMSSTAVARQRSISPRMRSVSPMNRTTSAPRRQSAVLPTTATTTQPNTARAHILREEKVPTRLLQHTAASSSRLSRPTHLRPLNSNCMTAKNLSGKSVGQMNQAFRSSVGGSVSSGGGGRMHLNPFGMI